MSLVDHKSETQQADFETISAHRMRDPRMKRTYYLKGATPEFLN
jgi:hypothetical protein